MAAGSDRIELEAAEAGTPLRVVETGCDALSATRRATAFRLNSDGRAARMRTIEHHVAAS